MVTIARVPCLDSNYGWLVHCSATGMTISVDTPEAKPLKNELKKRGWALTHILNTHHHHDHVGGNGELVAEYNCKVIGCDNDADRIPNITDRVKEGDILNIGNLSCRVIETPGHTSGHICYFFEGDSHPPMAFVGDTLFSLGCGRLFEGTASQMHASLSKLKNLPAETQIYCAHEYTEANGKFALSVDPKNPSLLSLFDTIREKRKNGEATVPMPLSQELACNPFLRSDAALKQSGGLPETATDVEVFAKIRSMKDKF
eukprot:TRINITY_DN11652_c0_g1_i1.p1 TRINITY_DN11652_c0_g1~~TRINITY_DN11652_c0_g1_i1.p1  ORF type:complete len:276 (+),score=52.67 TRINITY_DN11652_c0_g1_i1:55-828(+)